MLLPLALTLVTPAHADWRTRFETTIQVVEQMVWNPDAQQKAAARGLSVLNVTWEDTGRSKGSSVGPNISDMTIGVRDLSGALHPMPVIRFDNFSDKTADVRSEEFFLRTGNEDGRSSGPPRWPTSSRAPAAICTIRAPGRAAAPRSGPLATSTCS